LWKVGDHVARKSYGRDICFIIVDIDSIADMAVLKGVEVRLIADAPMSDLVSVTSGELITYAAGFNREERESRLLIERARLINREKRAVRAEAKFRASDDFFERPGRVLHLDGDGTYLNKCINSYEGLGIRAFGYHVEEPAMKDALMNLLEEHQPDILVLTGHDGLLRRGADYSKVQNYRNSQNFIKAIKIARRFERGFDDLIIIAGACQSHYEAMLSAGANFASSPQRVLIHALDPVYVAEKIAFTPINQTINMYEIAKSTITGIEGIGGIESRGKYRIGLPRASY